MEQVKLSREVIINGERTWIQINEPAELLRFDTPEAKAVIESDFKWAIDRLQRKHFD